MLTYLVGADEADGADGGVVQDEVDGLVRAVNDVDHTGRYSRLVEQLHEEHARSRVALGRLDDHRVATHERHREHLLGKDGKLTSL